MYVDDRVASSLTQQEGRGDGIIQIVKKIIVLWKAFPKWI